jgi:large subunit ribosomal protein L29
MKPSEIREMSPDEMQQKLKDLKEELFNLRFQLEVGQLENSARLKQTKKDIARVRTVLRQSELQQKEA